MKKKNKTALRVLSTATFLAMVASCTVPAFAATYDISVGNISVSARGDSQYVSQWTEDADKNRTYTTEDHKEEDETIITGASSSNSVTIDAEKDQKANVTLDNVNIDASKTGKAAITVSGNSTIELDGNNTLKSGANHAGLEKVSPVDDKHPLTIKDDDNNGKLTAIGGSGGAGIGGKTPPQGYAHDITITGGDITTIGGKGSAGIGGAGEEAKYPDYGCANSTVITISGENTKVTAIGGEGGSGIGAGYSTKSYHTGNGGYLTIKDGAQVTATGGKGAAGIGGGDGINSTVDGGQGFNISITGEGTQVTATGGEGGAGIGGGNNKANINGAGRGVAINITGGTVTATGNDGGAGIGGGKGSSASLRNGGDGVTISGGNVTATGGNGAAGIGSGKDSGWALGSHVRITGGTVTATGGAGNAAGIGAGENDAGTATVTINTTGAEGSTLDVTAVAKNDGEAISGESGITMDSLGNAYSGIVRFFHNSTHYNTVHNGQYVGMADNNADEHLETDAHIWGDTEIIKRAAPDEQGILRHHCAVPGCKGYYDEPYDYVEPDDNDPTTPTTPDVKPDTPATPETPENPPVQDVTPGTADTTPADSAVLPGNVQNPDVLDAKPEDAPVTPANAVNPAVQNAKSLPQTGSNWLAVLGTALSGAFLMAAGFFLDRKRGKNR